MGNLQIKRSGTWIDGEPWVKRGGSWAKALEVHVRRGGSWEKIWPSISKTLVDRTSGSLITDFSIRSTNAFDGTTNRTSTTCAVGGTYIGKTWSSPKIFAEAVIYGSNNVGFSSTGTPSITLSIYGKNGAAPSSASDGTLLGTITFTETNNESGGRTITSTDDVNAWDHWFMTETGHAGTLNIAQVTWSEWL